MAKLTSKSNSPSDIVIVFIIEINGVAKGERWREKQDVLP